MQGITEPLLQVQRALPATLLLVAVSSTLALGAGHLQARSALSEETGTSLGCPAAAQLICTRQAATRELLEEAPGGKPICCLHTQDGEEGAALPLLPREHRGLLWQAGGGRGCLLTNHPLYCHLFPRLAFQQIQPPSLYSYIPALLPELSLRPTGEMLSCPRSHIPCILFPAPAARCQLNLQRNSNIVPLASKRAELFKAIYVSIKSVKIQPQQRTRDLCPLERKISHSHIHQLVSLPNQWPGGLDRNESDAGLVIK